MEKEILSNLGTAAVWTAAIFTILDRSLSLRDRLRKYREKPESELDAEASPDPVAPEPRPVSIPAPPTEPSRYGPLPAFLIGRELLVILGVGLLLNYLGLVLSSTTQSVLYLDMTGTAFVAFLLGPWWGALVALLSNSFVNWLLYADPSAALAVFPWFLVNMTGGLFWGWMARGAWFRRFVHSGGSSGLNQARFLLQFGVLGAVVMALPGAFVQVSEAARAGMSLNPAVSGMIEQLVEHSQVVMGTILSGVVGVAWGKSLGSVLVTWAQLAIHYVPDKTMSVAIALGILKYGFPVFESELIHGGPLGQPPRDNRLAPLLLGLLYVPPFAILFTADLQHGGSYWLLWLAPWVIILAGYFILHRVGPSEDELHQARWARTIRYLQTLPPPDQSSRSLFGQRLILTTLIASAVIMMGFPFVIDDYQHATLQFFFVVYGFLLAIHLLKEAISQNLIRERLSMGQLMAESREAPPSAPIKTRAKRAARP